MKTLLLSLVVVLLGMICLVTFNPKTSPMPVLEDHPLASFGTGVRPIENRNPEVRKWLAVSLKINTGHASGSGTIIYFNSTDNYAYVQSCGHLWQGNMSGRKGVTCSVQTWYHNDQKISPKSYPAEVLYYSNTRGKDISLIRFKATDWKPGFFPIAKAGYPLPKGTKLHSCGCDGGREVAHYDVEVVRLEVDLVTRNNSPRPGRSGGGLMTADSYVGICWGTSDVSGNGIGLFTPLSVIRSMNEQNGFGWLNEVSVDSLAHRLPIIDRNNKQGKYPKNYIPLPGGRF